VHIYFYRLFQHSKRPQILTSAPPWGVLAENHIYQLVVREGDRPDRLDSNIEQKYGLTDKIWGIIEASWQKEATLRPTFNQIVELWQIRQAEDTLETLRPISPSTSIARQIFVFLELMSGTLTTFRIAASSSVSQVSGSSHTFTPSDSQSTLNSVQAWRSRQIADSRLATSMPPAYRDLSIKRPQLSSAGSTLGVLSAGQIPNTDALVRSTDESARQVSPPSNSSSGFVNEDSSTLFRPTNPDTNTLTSLNSGSVHVHQRHRSPLGGVSDAGGNFDSGD
jgi:hypothetical protein